MFSLPRAFSAAALAVSVTLPAAGAQSPQQPVPSTTLPPVIVTAQKEPADQQILPISVSAVDRDTLGMVGANLVSDAALFSPNTLFAELTARKVSNPYIRGVGSSPSNPGVTTYIDGVPQLNANSSNVELFDIERIEFVRGAQSALFGRNAIGGVVSLTTARPSMTQWTGHVEAPVGSQRERAVRLVASGPVAGRAAVGLAFGTRARDGYTVNDITGKTLDDRSATFGRAQFVLMPSANWEARLVVGGERDRDGDYALNDLDAVRRNPYHVQRDAAGSTRRDIWSSTVLLRYEGDRIAFSSTTGGVWWKTRDLTDLDYSALPLLTRDNRERDAQYSQEFRVASAARSAQPQASRVSVEWQAGVVLFSQHYTQDAATTFAPYLLSASLPLAVEQRSPNAKLDDKGLGAYAQATVTAWTELGLTLGARFDRESRAADIATSYDPAIAAPTQVNGDRTYSDVSPQAAVTWRPVTHAMLYASIGRGFKAGGFNTWAPSGNASYGEEHAWNVESGLKTTWAGGRLLANAAYYRIDWSNMQLTVPTPGAPAQFYIANVGSAKSSGFEFTLTAKPTAHLQLFGAAGTTDAVFGPGSRSSGIDVAGNTLPLAPDYTASAGARLSSGTGRSLGLYGGAEVMLCGAYQYDDVNRAGQAAYSLVNARVGLRMGVLGVEAWVRNAFETNYVPLAFAYGSLTPSGYIGEPGAPRTFGVTARLGF
jgi:iron complex outermembrane recepter protein